MGVNIYVSIPPQHANLAAVRHGLPHAEHLRAALSACGRAAPAAQTLLSAASADAARVERVMPPWFPH